MDDTGLKKLLTKGSQELGIRLTDEQAELFLIYLKELKAWNKKINLTSIEGDSEIVIRHFLDSFTACKVVAGSKRLLDVGAGAGFPGIPIKMIHPSIELVLLDSVEKKVHFLRHIIRTLGLKGAEAQASRIEDPEFIEKYKESFDCVISRAFSDLKKYLSLIFPYISPGGKAIAIKGPAYEEELKEAQTVKGFNPSWEIHTVKIPFEDRENTIIVFKKE